MATFIPARPRAAWSAAALALLLTACGAGSSPTAPPAPVEQPSPPVAPLQYVIGGSANGLDGRAVLQNNADDDLTLDANGPFAFTTPVTSGASYAVTIRQQPLWQHCNVENGMGQAATNVSDVALHCAPALANVTPFAGSGMNDDLDGEASLASFVDPTAVALDANGTLYLSSGSAIRKISPLGTVTTLTRDLVSPQHMVVDASGNIYVADSGAHLVRKITPAGVITTVAGNGAAMSMDGQGSSASFNRPWGIALDAAGNLYVTESAGHRIRKITPDAMVTTFAGTGMVGNMDGLGTAAGFSNPKGITLDAAGTIYLADKDNHSIRTITKDGMVSTLTNSTGARVAFTEPSGVQVDAQGAVYVGTSRGRIVGRVSPAGVVTTLAGQPGIAGSITGSGSGARFVFPSSVALDGAGNLFVLDTGTRLIRKITPQPAP